MKRMLWVGILLVMASYAHAVNYYISPSGNNGNDGLSQALPKLTFGHTLPLLSPGDTLFLLNGTYTIATNDVPQFNCASGVSNGTAGNPITMKALNERQAHVQSDGSKIALLMINCSYWTIEGIYWTGADNTTGQFGDGSVMHLNTVHHLIIRRNIGAFTNRFFNSHVLEILEDSDDNLIEENEIYSSNRHGILLFASGADNVPQRNVVRRNYIDSREYGNIEGGQTVATVPYRGATGISCYPCQNNIFENNIVEDWDAGFDIQCKFSCDNNRFYGNIVLNSGGMGFTARGDNYPNSLTQMPTDIIMKDNVIYHGERGGDFTCRVCKNVQYTNNTSIDWHVHPEVTDIFTGTFIWDLSCGPTCGEGGDGIATVFATNNLVVNAGGGAGGAHYVSEVTTWAVDYLRAYNTVASTPDFSDAHYTNISTNDPGMGTCKVYIPDGSNLKGAGLGGADIGANVLYRYQDGVLTTTPLWDTTTGAFPCGAFLSGVNDIVGASCFDVHTRLNVNSGGCAFPAGFGTPAVPDIVPTVPVIVKRVR